MISVNRRAAAIVRQMIDEAEVLGLEVHRLGNGTIVLDAGIQAPGSLEAGCLFARACMGGLGRVDVGYRDYSPSESDGKSGFQLPVVTVSVDHPHLACMGSQYAGWAVKQGKYSAIGSGPARALYASENIFQAIGYRDQSENAVLMLEGRELPGEAVAVFVADKCGVKPENLVLAVAPTASLVGSLQIAARSVETGLHKFSELGFDVRRFVAAVGLCPLAPVAADDLRAIGRTNDAILYGSQVCYSVRAEDDELASLIGKIPSSSSRDYGVAFYDLFLRFKGDFYKIDRLLFSPAEVQVNNLNSGRTFHAGCINPSLLKTSLLES